MIEQLLGFGATLFIAFFSALHFGRKPVPEEEPETPPEPKFDPSEASAPPTPVSEPPAPKTVPVTVPESDVLPVKTTPNMLDLFCTAQRDFEGKPGDRNYRNNNPGNFRYSPVGYLKMYGNVRKDRSGFAIFPTYELGWRYLQNHVKNKAKQHPDWTIRNYVDAYAPPVDDNPNNAAYARAIAKKCGVPVDCTLRQLFG